MYINGLVLSYCGDNLKANLARLASHPLELYRMSLLHKDTIVQVPVKTVPRFVHSHTISVTKVIENAVELEKIGVRFRANYYYSTSLRSINFDPRTGWLKLPVLPVHSGTEHLLLNLIAYEQKHADIGNEITSYVMFMDALIDTEDDVKLLQVYKN